MGREGRAVKLGKGLEWVMVLALTLALQGFGDPPESGGRTERDENPLPLTTRMVLTEETKSGKSSADTPGSVAVEEVVSVVYAPIGVKSAVVALPGSGAVSLVQKLKPQEETVRPFRPMPMDRAMPGPWDLGPVPVRRGSPAARLRNAANTEENRQEALRLRMEYWETVNTAVKRRELFERLAAEESKKRRPQGDE